MEDNRLESFHPFREEEVQERRVVRKASPSPEKRGKKKSRRDDDSDESEESGKRKVSDTVLQKRLPKLAKRGYFRLMFYTV